MYLCFLFRLISFILSYCPPSIYMPRYQRSQGSFLTQMKHNWESGNILLPGSWSLLSPYGNFGPWWNHSRKSMNSKSHPCRRHMRQPNPKMYSTLLSTVLLYRGCTLHCWVNTPPSPPARKGSSISLQTMNCLSKVEEGVNWILQ